MNEAEFKLRESEAERLQVLERDEYVRQRIAPAVGDPLYLHLSDLKEGLSAFGPYPERRILDYGCGGSPYRSLFSAEVYHRADISGHDLDFTFRPDSRISAPASSYDLVLSTQVLEHVADVASYLSEARRILTPGGRLVLSTHGLFQDHGCPYDFHRWTADGLRSELEAAGFTCGRCAKLTTGPRALAFMNQQFHRATRTRGRSLLAVAWNLSWQLYARSRRKLNRMLDQNFSGNRVVDGATPGHEVYIGLIIEGRRS